jgi:SNF2 family DNA or RNA helicase
MIEQRAPKIRWMLSTLQEISENREKVLIFCEVRDLQRMLQRVILERFCLLPEVINGDTATNTGSAASRQKKLRAFQQQEGFGVMILSPLAVGFGVNIQAANHVIHFVRLWNPAREDQATDRAYRIGQTKDVFVYYPTVVAEDFVTFDAKLDELLERKRSLSDDMLNGIDGIQPGEFGDLQELVRSAP